MSRVFNFCAGPCTLPVQVLEEARVEMLDYQESGMSIIEMSHRGAQFDAIHKNATRLALELFGVPDEFDILFIQGGATLQFAMVPMNLLKPGQKAAYINSGSWGKGAITDAKPYGDIEVVWDGKDDNYMRMPNSDEIKLSAGTRYLHITSNETIGGVRFADWPDVGVPLVADMSSDYMSRPVPWEKFDLIYGGVQKNLGPSGMAVVFIRKSILEETNKDMARYLRYDVHQDKESLFNTPPVFSIYMFEKVLRWMEEHGGIEAMQQQATEKANTVYDAIDNSGGFYKCPVEKSCRSHMNVVFTMPKETQEKKFLMMAAEHDLLNLKGHRSVGGCRASLYNAMPLEGAEALAAFMKEFAENNS